MKNFKKYIYPASALLLALVLLSITFVSLSKNNNQEKKSTKQTSAEAMEKDEITYQGEEGVDAYILLTKKADIEEDTSGLITSINGKKADNNKKEFWSFYVNDKQAAVGPKDYITKDSDIITWKIESYE